MLENTKRYLLTMGDPNGVGPEICLKLLQSKSFGKGRIPILIGDPTVLEKARQMTGVKKNIVVIQSLVDADKVWPKGIPVYSAGISFSEKVQPGKVTKACGVASIGYVRRAVELVQQGLAHAVVTAPLCKEAVEKTVPGFQGHTEYIGEMCGDPEPVLALVHGSWVVAHVSTHVSLRNAVDRAQKERIVKVGRLLQDFLQRYTGKKKPLIGVAGINPHAGEGGLFGLEEEQEIAPAVKSLRKLRIDAQGPLPGDVIFPQLQAGRFDGVIAMYHDQGHVVTKTLFFDLGKKRKVGGVNTTLGLPVLRTSVDHGTGFDIAWQGIASELSLRDALELAIRLT